MKRYIAYILLLVSAMLLGACTDELPFPEQPHNEGAGLIALAGQISQQTVSRANDDGFADGDVMGVYVVDYQGTTPGELLVQGNRGDNVRHTFNEKAYSWKSAFDLYWKDKHTRIDVYGYYPFDSPESIDAYKFTVRPNQHVIPTDGTMGDYEASDFLWGKVAGVEPTTNVIRLPLAHRMANARVTLVKGSGFGEGEWDALEKQVLVTNTVHEATVNLATGAVVASGSVAKKAIVPSRRGNEWRAIVVPQSIASGTTLFSITLGGIPYKFVKAEEFEYVSGKMSNFAIKVDRKTAAGDYALSLVSESITPWEDDLVSHDAAAKEYVIVNSTPGGLKAAITAAGKDFTTLKNLKITGEIDARDFYFMRDEMEYLAAVNLKEVKIKAYDSALEDQIPADAFCGEGSNLGKTSLNRVVLPDQLRSIGRNAFHGCQNLTGSLVIPEGVIDIQNGAFFWCHALTGSLSLPSTLRYIGNVQDARGNPVLIKDGGHGVFTECGFTCELNLPDKLEYIAPYAFERCTGFYGNLRLPEKLTYIGKNSFNSLRNISGSLEIPQGVSVIEESTFELCGFNGNLQLHDGITGIGKHAFYYCRFKGELILPKNLVTINDEVFYSCDFSGRLVLPKELVNIGARAFAYNWRLTGVLEFPEGTITIGAGAFAHCRMLEGVVFPESLENIQFELSFTGANGAFQECYGIGSIVSRSEIPPYIAGGTFDGVAKDNFTVEVPEGSVEMYKTAVGWRDFKRVAAHHELVCRPAVACALSTEHRQTLVLNSEGEWELISKPDWCELSQTSGSKKTELTLNIKEYASTSGEREGDIVFRLKGKGYTTKCHVVQNGYAYGEDEFMQLQKATKGRNGGINIVIVGDGYDSRNIAEGSYLKDMRDEVEMFFGIEPFTTYRDYFNVYTAFALSTESGVGTVNTIRYNRFNTTYTGGVGLRCDYDDLFEYVLQAPANPAINLNQTLVIVIPNSTDYGGICQMWSDGAAIAFCPKSTYGYPLDSRGVIQHEACGHGFGKLGDEYINHNAFIDFCGCTCCGHVLEFSLAKSWGWCDNLELTGKMHKVGWSHLIFDPRYCDVVDIFEGGYMHTRGVFRSEQNSCMNNDISYFSTISRESIVKRIKRYAGEEFDFEEFVALDKPMAAKVKSRGVDAGPLVNSGFNSMPPVIHRGSPLSSRKSQRKASKR